MSDWLTTLQGSSARLFGVAVNIVLLVVTARVLGPAGRGEFAVATTWTAVFATFAGLSLGSVSHRQVQEHERSDWFPEIAGTMFVIGAVTSVLGLLVMWGMVVSGVRWFHGIPPTVMVVASLSLPGLVVDEYGRNLLSARNRVRDYLVAQAVGNAVRLVTILLALGPFGLRVSGVVAGFAFSQTVIAVLIGQAILRSSPEPLRWTGQQLRGLLSGAARLHLNTVAAFLLAQASVLVVNEFATKAEVGFYQFACQMVLPLVLLPQGASMVIFGKVAERGPDGAWPWQKPFMLRILALVTVSFAVAAVCAPALIGPLLGHEFEPVARIFPWLFPVVLGMSMAELMAPQWLGRGIFVPTTVLTCVAAVGNLVLTTWLVGNQGIMGAALGTALSYLIFVVGGQLGFAAWCQVRYSRFAR